MRIVSSSTEKGGRLYVTACLQCRKCGQAVHVAIVFAVVKRDSKHVLARVICVSSRRALLVPLTLKAAQIPAVLRGQVQSTGAG